MEYSIVIEPPDTKANFTAFNIPCDLLDSDYLMQPINEADYDSETQACVDKKEGKITSFYDHYVTKRRKKKNVRGCRIEAPVPAHAQQHSRVDAGPSTSSEEGHVQDPSFLMATSLLGTTSGVSKNALSNVAVRRVACGRMPPPMPTVSPPQPPQENTVFEKTPDRHKSAAAAVTEAILPPYTSTEEDRAQPLSSATEQQHSCQKSATPVTKNQSQDC